MGTDSRQIEVAAIAALLLPCETVSDMRDYICQINKVARICASVARINTRLIRLESCHSGVAS